MSANIDERVVALHFQNDGFEKGARESLKTLDELKKGLNFEEEEKKYQEKLAYKKEHPSIISKFLG